MADPRALAAIERIERALARIEAAAERAPSSPPDQRLAEAHRRLRGKVEAAIVQIDDMFAARRENPAERG